MNQIIKKIRNSKTSKRIETFLKGSAVQNVAFKIIALFIVWIIGLIPTWIAIGMWCLFDPVTFWQTLALLALLIFFLGGLQIFVGVLLIIFTIEILTKPF